MLSSKIFNSLEISKELSSYIGGIDDYDDPYFVILSCESNLDLAVKSMVDVAKTYEDDLYSCEAFELNHSLVLFSISCAMKTINAVSNRVLDSISATGLLVHISVFHHNSLGEALETFKWSTQLLEEVIQESGNKSSIGVNDFSDRENWDGIVRYRN
ncbi:hypothetical protein BCT35_16760 [Vibrio lentus]|uniref:hypothetical protein n=1 Tax=Vibrio lentus TaxID=136468 RepID=UPI000C846ECC|nr:hypothetical protein [Vibrio lentus]PMI41332.1 hypothetical protein BCU45_18895 [Vibrio lentus]PMI64428.1 hypothetical protein BCU40_15775 [Vibrio lentus]PMJ56316.1 hypothetical protein BCU20_20100 [Vibrio lentus]PML43544.1 hypothetical protein BCT75_06695 [Vibrio lentus]PMN04730.1 hypothetical protein BCT42_14025 [Vibrio lentus]